jgi:hypothetical protein
MIDSTEFMGEIDRYGRLLRSNSTRSAQTILQLIDQIGYIRATVRHHDPIRGD